MTLSGEFMLALTQEDEVPQELDLDCDSTMIMEQRARGLSLSYPDTTFLLVVKNGAATMYSGDAMAKYIRSHKHQILVLYKGGRYSWSVSFREGVR